MINEKSMLIIFKTTFKARFSTKNIWMNFYVTGILYQKAVFTGFFDKELKLPYSYSI